MYMAILDVMIATMTNTVTLWISTGMDMVILVSS
jgi:hypothetical protein